MGGVRTTACAALAGGLLALSWLAAAAAGFELVTAGEFQQEKDARALVLRGTEGKEEPATQRAPNGPVIEVVTPDAKAPVKAPVDIDVRFEPGPDARIVLNSLRIRYGLIGLDVTERIRKAATVDEHGIRAPGAQLPSG